MFFFDHNIFTDRVRSTREGNVFSLSTPRGGNLGRVRWVGGGGCSWWGGTQGGIPLAGGFPPQVPPLSDLVGATPGRGYPTSGTPPPPALYRITAGVLDMPRSVSRNFGHFAEYEARTPSLFHPLDTPLNIWTNLSFKLNNTFNMNPL